MSETKPFVGHPEDVRRWAENRRIVNALEVRDLRTTWNSPDKAFWAARALLGWTQIDLAKKSGLGESTVLDFERGKRKVADETVGKLRAALEQAGIKFSNTSGVRLE